MKQAQLHRLLLQMLDTLNQLGRDPMARIDARAFHEYYRKKLARLGIKP